MYFNDAVSLLVISVIQLRSNIVQKITIELENCIPEYLWLNAARSVVFPAPLLNSNIWLNNFKTNIKIIKSKIFVLFYLFIFV